MNTDAEIIEDDDGDIEEGICYDEDMEATTLCPNYDHSQMHRQHDHQQAQQQQRQRQQHIPTIFIPPDELERRTRITDQQQEDRNDDGDDEKGCIEVLPATS